MNLLKLLDRPIAFHRCFVDLTGSVNAALMLSQAAYWHNRTTDPDGWFYKTASQWQEETGLTRHEIEHARKKLRQSDYWQEELRGSPPKLHFRIDGLKLLKTIEKDESQFAGKRKIEFAGKRRPNLPESGKLNLPESGKSSLQNIDYMGKDYTETTSLSPAAGKGEKKQPKISPKKTVSNPNHHHPMVDLYRDISGCNGLNRIQCDLIADQVSDEMAWRHVLHSRAARGWNPRNVNAALVDYRRVIDGETIEQIHGGTDGRNRQPIAGNGNGKQQGKRYETASARRARETIELLDELDRITDGQH